MNAIPDTPLIILAVVGAFVLGMNLPQVLDKIRAIRELQDVKPAPTPTPPPRLQSRSGSHRRPAAEVGSVGLSTHGCAQKVLPLWRACRDHVPGRVGDWRFLEEAK